jgi:sn-glycerol 3-phosphate transport system permease protein
MIERTPLLNIATHAILAFGLVLILVPVWLAFVGATLTLQEVNSAPVEFWPGDQLFVNLVRPGRNRTSGRSS